MSRSYKHSPWIKDRSRRNQKQKKRFAAKKTRNEDDMPGHMGYKRISESWEISDYANRVTWQEFLHDFVKLYGNPTKKEENKLRGEWEKTYLRK